MSYLANITSEFREKQLGAPTITIEGVYWDRVCIGLCSGSYRDSQDVRKGILFEWRIKRAKRKLLRRWIALAAATGPISVTPE